MKNLIDYKIFENKSHSKIDEYLDDLKYWLMDYGLTMMVGIHDIIESRLIIPNRKLVIKIVRMPKNNTNGYWSFKLKDITDLY